MNPITINYFNVFPCLLFIIIDVSLLVLIHKNPDKVFKLLNFLSAVRFPGLKFNNRLKGMKIYKILFWIFLIFLLFLLFIQIKVLCR